MDFPFRLEHNYKLDCDWILRNELQHRKPHQYMD